MTVELQEILLESLNATVQFTVSCDGGEYTTYTTSRLVDTPYVFNLISEYGLTQVTK